jgi:Domain of unknown function (DUF4266)
MTILFRLSIVILIFGCGVLLGGCSTLGVKPWQRDILSRSDMRPDGAGLDDRIDEHLYFSKEASSGGRSFGGGGCGCN